MDRCDLLGVVGLDCNLQKFGIGNTRMKVHTGRPGRPREFDIDDATRDAMEVFWNSGFHATSLPDLIEGMGLTRGSIYKAYEDKRSIYLAALDAYVDAKLDRTARKLDRADKRAAIRDALAMTARECASELGRKGCFVTAALAEMVPNDPDVETRSLRLLSGLERLFADAIAEGKAAGSITSATPTAVLAKTIVCMGFGLSVLGKLGPSERANRKLTDVAIALLD